MECKKLNCWPVLKSYQGEQLRRIAMPLGGIETETVSLSGHGSLIDWELMNQTALISGVQVMLGELLQ